MHSTLRLRTLRTADLYNERLNLCGGESGVVTSQATDLVSIGNNINSRASPVALSTISRALLPMTSKADKLPLEAEPVARDNNTISR